MTYQKKGFETVPEAVTPRFRFGNPKLIKKRNELWQKSNKIRVNFFLFTENEKEKENRSLTY